MQPVLPTDHHGSAELSFVQTDDWTNSLQRMVRLLFCVKVPVTTFTSIHQPKLQSLPARKDPRGNYHGLPGVQEQGEGQGEALAAKPRAGTKRITSNHQVKAASISHLGSLLICHQPQPQLQTGPGLGAAQIEDKADMKDTNLAVRSNAFPSQPSPVCKTQRTANEISSWTSKPPERCFTSP